MNELGSRETATTIKCPECGKGCLTGTTDSLHRTVTIYGMEVATIKRRRKCNHCGKRTNTYEVTEAIISGYGHGLPALLERNLENEALITAIGKLALEGALK